MKRGFLYTILILLICLLISLSASAESILPDISNMSIEELLQLRNEINVMLESKGYAVYFDIERGAKGEEVSDIQAKLSELGFYTGKITGKYDSETQRAFKLFEKNNNLENDGLASREDQIILFGNSAVAKAPIAPSPSATFIPKNNVTNEHDTSFDYEDCMRYPDKYIGTSYRLKGKVEQTLGNRAEGFQIRFSVLGNIDEIIYIFVTQDPGYNILENDWMVIDLTMSGTITYESIWGQEITIPSAFASEVILR